MRNVNGIRVTTTTTTHDIPQPQFFLALSLSGLKTPHQPINTITGEAITGYRLKTEFFSPKHLPATSLSP